MPFKDADRHMIVYAQERLVDVKDEVAELGHQQTAEMAVGFEHFVEKPNWDWYLGLEAKGMLILLTARESACSRKDGPVCGLPDEHGWSCCGHASRRLVGYFGAYIYQSTTSQHRMVQATPYYVVPCRFRAIILKRLFQTLLAHPIARGGLVTIKTHTWASAGSILEHLGFRATETWYMLEQPQGGTPNA